MVAYTNYRTDARVVREAEAAISAGFDVDFLALRREGDPAVETIEGVRVIHLNQCRYRGGGLVKYMLSYLVFFIRCLVKTARLYLQKRYCIVHVNNMPDFMVFTTIVPKLFGAKVLLDIHDPMPNTFAAKFKKGEKSIWFKLLLWQELLSGRYADRIITVHELVKTRILVKHGLAADSIRVVTNFADERMFPLQPHYSPEGKLRLVFHGTILERYGLRTLMQGLASMRNRDQLQVRIIGEGDFSEELSQIIRSLDLIDTVEFLNRVYPYDEIPQQLCDCHLGLVPLQISSITNYALPLKLLEYISLGIPVISIRNAAIAYYFGEDDCLFYKPEDPESLRAVLDRVTEDRSLLVHYRQRAVEIREKFLWGNERQKYVRLLQSMANGHALESDRPQPEVNINGIR